MATISDRRRVAIEETESDSSLASKAQQKLKSDASGLCRHLRQWALDEARKGRVPEGLDLRMKSNPNESNPNESNPNQPLLEVSGGESGWLERVSVLRKCYKDLADQYYVATFPIEKIQLEAEIEARDLMELEETRANP